MLSWFKNLFSSVKPAPEAIEDKREVCPKCGSDPCVCPKEEPVVAEAPKEEVKTKTTAKPKTKATAKNKATAKAKKRAAKAAKADLDSMTKKDLLAHAKAHGIKSNASMSKAAILEAIKNG